MRFMKLNTVVSAFYIGKNPSKEAANGISEVSEKSCVPAGRDSTWALAPVPILSCRTSLSPQLCNTYSFSLLI